MIPTTEPINYTAPLSLHLMERRIIIRELRKTQLCKDAAELLGFNKRTLTRKIIMYNIKREEWKKK